MFGLKHRANLLALSKPEETLEAHADHDVVADDAIGHQMPVQRDGPSRDTCYRSRYSHLLGLQYSDLMRVKRAWFENST